MPATSAVLPSIEVALAPSNNPIILIAGGTGISPYIPYLLSNKEKSDNRIVKLFYGFRNKELFLFKEELVEVCNLLPNLELHCFCQETILEKSIQSGILDIEYIYEKTRVLVDPIYFLSGPPVMIGHFKKILIKNNVSKDYIRIDAWE